MAQWTSGPEDQWPRGEVKDSIAHVSLAKRTKFSARAVLFIFRVALPKNAAGQLVKVHNPLSAFAPLRREAKCQRRWGGCGRGVPS